MSFQLSAQRNWIVQHNKKSMENVLCAEIMWTNRKGDLNHSLPMFYTKCTQMSLHNVEAYVKYKWEHRKPRIPSR